MSNPLASAEARQAAERIEARFFQAHGEPGMSTREETIETIAGDIADSYADLVRERDAIELKYRVQLWSSHGHHGYGDDGELQCCECIPFGASDYRRDPLHKVEAACQFARLKRGTEIINKLEAEAAIQPATPKQGEGK